MKDEDDLKWECFDLEAYINNVVTFALNKTPTKSLYLAIWIQLILLKTKNTIAK